MRSILLCFIAITGIIPFIFGFIWCFVKGTFMSGMETCDTIIMNFAKTNGEES